MRSLTEAAASAPPAAAAAEASQKALVKDFQRLRGSKARLSLLCVSVCLLHRYLHPEGLPSDYTISMMLRLLPETPQEPFALWEILNKDNEPMVGLILDSESESLKVFRLSFFLSFSFPSFLQVSQGSSQSWKRNCRNMAESIAFNPIKCSWPLSRAVVSKLSLQELLCCTFSNAAELMAESFVEALVMSLLIRFSRIEQREHLTPAGHQLSRTGIGYT